MQQLQRMEPQPLPCLGQVTNLAVEALMQKHFPTYQQELTGSKLLPATVLDHLKRALPDEAFRHVMTHNSEEGTRIRDSYSVRFGGQTRSCRVRDLCKNQAVMAVLYQLIAIRQVTWAGAQDFVKYVHVLEGIENSAQDTNLAVSLMQKYFPLMLLRKSVHDALKFALPDDVGNVSSCVRDLCENKKAMVALYHLLITRQLQWEHHQLFVNYVHILEDIETSAEANHLTAEALMQKHFPTCKHELTGSMLLPATVLDVLKSALPDEEGFRNIGSCRVRDLCKDKKVMAVLYRLMAIEEATWEHGQDFLNYVHAIEDIKTSAQANNIVAEALAQKFWPTYPQDFIGSQRLPSDIVRTLEEELPDSDFHALMGREVAPRRYPRGPRATVHHCRVRKLCKNKRVMVVLYQLIATGQVKWEHGQGFLDYVHVLEGLGS